MSDTEVHVSPSTKAAVCPHCGQATGRKHWIHSYKVRCAWIASFFPVAASVVWFWTGEITPSTFVALGMAPWMALGGTEGAIDWKTATKPGSQG